MNEDGYTVGRVLFLLGCIDDLDAAAAWAGMNQE